MKVVIKDKYEYRKAKDTLDKLFDSGREDTMYYEILEAVRKYEKRYSVIPAVQYCPYSIS